MAAKLFERNEEPEDTGKIEYDTPGTPDEFNEKHILASGATIAFIDSGKDMRLRASATGFIMQRGEVLKTNVTHINELLTGEDITEMKEFHYEYKWLLGDPGNE